MGLRARSESSLMTSIDRVVSSLSCKTWRLTAPAKINIRLKVTGRRHDGYHYLSMLNTSCSLCDDLVVSPRDERGISVSVDLPSLAAMPVADNLIAKAYTRFFEEFGCLGDGPGFAVSIVKRIPVGGGLGGGSSDAGAFLRFLVSLFGETITQALGITEREFDSRVMTVALACGADVPYAYRGGVAWVTGIGETVTRLPISRLWKGPVLISVPSRPVPTAEFYRFFKDLHPSIAPRRDLVMEEYSHGSRELDLGSLIENDFEEVACQLVPEVGAGLALAREFFAMTTMTGSGCAIVSLVESGSEARIAEYQRRAALSGMVISQVSL